MPSTETIRQMEKDLGLEPLDLEELASDLYEHENIDTYYQWLLEGFRPSYRHATPPF